jgi:hypothetical protein
MFQFRFQTVSVRLTATKFSLADVVIEMINKAMYLQAMRIILAFEFQEAFPLAPTLALIIEKLEHDTKDESEGQALVCLSSFFYCMSVFVKSRLIICACFAGFYVWRNQLFRSLIVNIQQLFYDVLCF